MFACTEQQIELLYFPLRCYLLYIIVMETGKGSLGFFIGHLKAIPPPYCKTRRLICGMLCDDLVTGPFTKRSRLFALVCSHVEILISRILVYFKFKAYESSDSYTHFTPVNSRYDCLA